MIKYGIKEDETPVETPKELPVKSEETQSEPVKVPEGESK